MKSWFSVPKHLFTLLIGAAILASALGAYLTLMLTYTAGRELRTIAVVGLALWNGAWILFGRLCLRLRRGESAFAVATGRTLRLIGWCMLGLAAITVLSAFIGGARVNTAYWLVEFILLPGLFLAVYVVSKILRGLLEHAISLEAEQEGVV
jgi:hypothetical protein